MRTIKFRCWVKEIREGDYVLSGHMNYNPEWGKTSAVKRETKNITGEIKPVEIQFERAKINEIFSGRERTLMQYTGLKDKNGKEIYEGDIVKFPQPTSIPIREIRWEECGFNITRYDEEMGVEVIGNIMENKELIK